MWTGRGNRIKFHKTVAEETNVFLHNPGCGWYHVYSFAVRSSSEQFPEEGESPPFLYEEESLALVLIDIGAFQCSGLSEGALSYIGCILKYFSCQKKQLILRFAYDTEGRGMEREPSTVSLIKRHMEQLGSVICRYADHILVVQGLLIGSWGEMHSSKFLTERYLTELADTMYRATEGSCYLAVRTPAQWRKIVSCRGIDPALSGRLALFNDGMFGSPTDLGTYGMAARQDVGEKERWHREEELDWQSRMLASVPNGGEALSGEQPTGYRQAAEQMRKMHVTYLNSTYEEKQLVHWKAETVKERGCWKGVSGYEYIGRHLVYRFVIRDVKLLRGDRIRSTVENCGFAGICEETDCLLTAEDGEGRSSSVRVDTDPGQWECGKQTIIDAAVPRKESGVDRYMLYLELKRKRDGRTIRFANRGNEKRVPLGRLDWI